MEPDGRLVAGRGTLFDGGVGSSPPSRHIVNAFFINNFGAP
jgi:hypothetical protein